MNPMNPNALLRLRTLLSEFQTGHPKAMAFFGMVGRRPLPEGAVIELTVTYPGEAPVSTNLRVNASDVELLQELGQLGQLMKNR